KSRIFTVKTASTMQSIVLPGNAIDAGIAPDHLLVLVHGIWASPADWTNFEAELKRRLGKNFLIHVSSCNTYSKTLTGIHDSGRRLADEVLEVVRNAGSLRKISFLAHSLGGLIARYAVGILYQPDVSYQLPTDIDYSASINVKISNSSNDGLIAGLEPINFITLATPHLGVRGNKQFPLLLGVPLLERIVPPIAPLFVGTTGRQLFLTDGGPDSPPLLLRMTSDCDDGKFISALGAFRSRVLYSNVSCDHMVGWRTSSIRRETELVKSLRESLDGYKHIVKVENCLPTTAKPPENEVGASKNRARNHEIIEEKMIRGLQGVGWLKVDVNFGFTFLPFLAHNAIHVKNTRIHYAGGEIISHVSELIKQQEEEA
ncbi:hypothetical protein M569_02226, partial [Genlisea aurea]